MATSHATTIGAGILGNLRYHDDIHAWAISLGQCLAIFELTSAGGADQDPKVSATNAAAVEAINELLVDYGLPDSLHVAATTADPKRSSRQIFMLLKHLKLSFSPSHAALLLIGHCSNVLRQEPAICKDDPQISVKIIDFAKEQLDAIGNEVPELLLSPDALWQILRSQAPQDLTTAGVRSLLRKLSAPLIILIVSADPRDGSQLRLAEERRELDQALRATRFRDSFTIRDMTSCRVRDIARALDDHNPDILLFTGHGSSQGLCFEDDLGRVQVVEKANLAALLEEQKSLKLVIMNACYSQDQAQCIADAVGHVIGMEGAIRDRDAIDFSREFFTALGHGRTFEDSFRRAKAAVHLQSSSRLKAHYLKAVIGGPSAPQSYPPARRPTLQNSTRIPTVISAWYLLAGTLAVVCGVFCYAFEGKLWRFATVSK